MSPIRIAIVGVGKIVRDQHAPVLAADPNFQLVATASPNSSLDGVPSFTSLPDLLAAKGSEVDAVAICTTTQVRHEIARTALLAGKAALLEKPPAATLSELADLRALAEARKLPLYATWHSRHAPAVVAARDWLARHPPKTVEVIWKEDVRHWHPGQAWVWEPGGLGVFDPGINALSILTAIMPAPVFLKSAELQVPAGRQAPIAADLVLGAGDDCAVTAAFDWRQTGEQTWDIRVEARDGGRLRLSGGGSRLEIDGAPAPLPPDDPHGEYAGIYRRFAELVRAGQSEVDGRPLELTADAFLLGRRTEVEAFND